MENIGYFDTRDMKRNAIWRLLIYPSDLKMPDSEPHILFQFKEKNAAE
jgi:hypothetical protein